MQGHVAKQKQTLHVELEGKQCIHTYARTHTDTTKTHNYRQQTANLLALKYKAFS